MPIIDLQRRLREIGRIRIGQQVPIANPKQGSKARTRPVKLETFRLTSRDQRVVDAAAALYGGTAQPWAEQPGQHEVITQASELPILVPPGGLALTQWYELWSGGGCLRRCDGQTEYVGDQGCICDPEKRECSIHTRLSVVLSDLQGLGVWRLDTQGWYAATELGSVVPLLEGAAERGRFLPARLRLEQRQVLRDGKTMKFAVPVIDIDVTVGQMRSLVSGAQPVAALADPTTGEIAPPEPAGLTPVRELAEGPSVTEQVKTAEAPASRARANTPQLPPTGVQPRSRAEAEDAGADEPTLGTSRTAAPRSTLPPPEEVALKRSQRVAIRLGELGFDDDGRHHLISAVTNGVKASGKELTAEEEGNVVHAGQEIAAGRRQLVKSGEGWVMVPVEDATGDDPDDHDDENFDGVGDESGWTADKWRRYLTARGVKMVELIRKAQELASDPEIGATPPGNLEGLVGQSNLCALLRGFVEERYEEQQG